MGATLYEKTLQRAFRLLSYKARTVAEMRQRLLEKEWSDGETVEQVINRLLELNYLNDDEYAANFVNNRLAVKPLGPTRLRRDLQRRNLPRRRSSRPLPMPSPRGQRSRSSIRPFKSGFASKVAPPIAPSAIG